MLYAPVQAKDYWPLDWEKCFNMHRHLNQMAWGYQFILEKKMFAVQFGPEYRCALVKWDNETPTAMHTQTNLPQRIRTLLLETDDPKQMEAALLMLINEAEAQAKDEGRVRVRP